MGIAYIHSIGGVSGDMLLSALIGSGIDVKELESMLHQNGVFGFELEVIDDVRKGINGKYLDVRLDPEGEQTRSISDFLEIVSRSNLSDSVKLKCTEIIQMIGLSESVVHKTSLDDVHLHELGTVDTLIDVIGVVWGFEKLGVSKIYCSALPTGAGQFKSAHGVMSIPGPAVSEMISMKNIPVYPPDNPEIRTGELLTPTGVAIVSCVAEFSNPLMNLSSISYGLGTRDSELFPNVLGLWLGTLLESSNLVVLETNIDDSSPEILGYVKSKLIDNGAKDVWITPIQMKKDRPGMTISVLTNTQIQSLLEEILFTETTTLGIRYYSVDRTEVDREILSFESTFGEVRIKIKKIKSKIFSVSPEFEDCKAVAQKLDLPLIFVMKQVENEANQFLGIDFKRENNF